MVIGSEKLSMPIQGVHPARLIEAALLRTQSIFHQGGDLTKVENFGIDLCPLQGSFSANLAQQTLKDIGSISKIRSTFGDLQFQLMWPNCPFWQIWYMFLSLQPNSEVEEQIKQANFATKTDDLSVFRDHTMTAFQLTPKWEKAANG